MERSLKQPTFTDAAAVGIGSARNDRFFADIQQMVPWDDLAKLCADVFDDSDPQRGGRPHWPVKLMLKVQFLQACFNLSDPGVEEAINDRLSFRRFLGLSLEERAPDQSAVQEFRDRMIAAGHGSTVFDRVVQMLEGHGLILKGGTIVDATLIERGRGDWSRSEQPGFPLHTRDKTAGTTVQGGRTTIAQRAIIATDLRGTIKDYVYDTAAVHESNHFEQLTRAETVAVWADKAFWSKQRMKSLPQRGIFPGIGIKRMPGQTQLTEEQKHHNRVVAKVRAMIEHPFALIKRQLGLRRLIYRGLAKNAFRFAWVATVANLKRNLDPWRAAITLGP